MIGTPDLALDTAARRRLGRYDTPESVALPLVRWGLRGRPGKILDPSFGGCNFLRASLRALGEAGASSPGRLVFGVDIAEEARHHSLSLIECGVPPDNLVTGDFFAMTPRGLPAVDLIVGNPPYIRHHWFQDGKRERAVAALARQRIRLSGQANAWAYFIVHSGAFLRKGGRMALLLPGAVCFADYASAALDYIRKHARRCTLARIGKRLFANAREDTVVLLVEDWGSGPCDLTVGDFDSIEDLELWLLNRTERLSKTFSSGGEPQARNELEGQAADAWQRALGAPSVQRLGELARVRIGIVTGANRFFVQLAEDARRLEAAGAGSAPIVTRGRSLAGLEWSKQDQLCLERSGTPSRLILVEPEHTPQGALLQWVKSGKDEGLPNRFYCRRRKVWYALRDQRVPDAFLRYMGEEAPRIVLNSAAALATNAIHRVWWHDKAISPEAVAIASCTSFFALACELYGRKYGGGVLKIEPGAAGRLPMPIVPAAAPDLAEIDILLRTRNLPAARELADEVVLVRGLGLSQETATTLRRITTRLTKRRRCQERLS